MRQLGAVLGVVGAAAVMGPVALAATPHRVKTHHFVMVKHLPPGTMRARTTIGAHTTVAAARAAMRPALALVPPGGPASSALPLPAAPTAPATCPPGQTSGPYCVGPPAPDTLFETVSINGTASEPVTTNAKDTMLVAFVQSDGPMSGGQSSTVSGGGLNWIKAASQNKALGDAEVWYAMLPSHRIFRQTITASASIKGFDENLSIVSFQNASGVGATGTFSSSRGAPSGTITTTQPNSWVWASGTDWGGAVRRTVPTGQAAVIQLLDLTARKTFWTQTTLRPTANAGTPVTINDTAPSTDPFNLVLVEIL